MDARLEKAKKALAARKADNASKAHLYTAITEAKAIYDAEPSESNFLVWDVLARLARN